MTSRFRTCSLHRKPSSLREEGGKAGLRLGAEAATLSARLLLAILLLFTVISAPARAATPVGTVISNSAAASYTDGPASGPLVKSSNTVTVSTVEFRTRAIIEFLKYAPQLEGATPTSIATGAYRTGSDPAAAFVAMAAPLLPGTGTSIDLTKPAPLSTTAVYHGGDPIFIRITDLDQNLDSARAETVLATVTDGTLGDLEVVVLTETGLDTGVFVGYIQSTANNSPASYSGTLPVTVDSDIKAGYTDIYDSSDSVDVAALVDPYGIFFDSSTGAPVDGVAITLIDVATGQPAAVLGDDGVSAFPASVTSGGTTSDTLGRIYDFPPGGFRYPFVNPGSYRFQITAPPGYRGPSAVADAVLQNLAGGPFALVTPGSRLEPFTINPGPAIHIDIPLDPLTAVLWLQKSAGLGVVAVGDFLPYRLDLQNTDAAATATGVLITDTLPPGFRYRKGSARLNGAAAADPAISPDGRTLSFSVGDLAPRGVATLGYVVEVAVGARPGSATNQATARSAAGAVSNLATARVLVRSDFMNSRSIIMGQVTSGACGAPREETPGVAGIRLFLEDGTYAVTDKNGMYHFEGVHPGSHVVQMDLDSVPARYELLSCERNSRFAGTPYSQFVDLQGGTLWRADFRLRLRPAATGAASLELRSVLKNRQESKEASVLKRSQQARDGSDTVEFSVPVRIGTVPAHNLRLTVMLPDGVAYQAGSSSLETAPHPDPSDTENVLTFGLGDVPGEWEATVRFQVSVPRAGKDGALATRALLTFDTPGKKNVRTPVADNVMVRRGQAEQPAAAGIIDAPIAVPGASDQPGRGAGNQTRQAMEEKRIVMPPFVLYPHFPTFGAELDAEDRQMLDDLARLLMVLNVEQIGVTGHTDHVRIAPRSRGIYPDNKALSRARARSVGNYLMEALHLPQSKLVFSGMGDTEPVADNRSAAGRALNRRVEINVRATRVVGSRRSGIVSDAAPAPLRVELPPPSPAAGSEAARAPAVVALSEISNEKDRSGVKSVATVGLRPGEEWTDPEAGKALAAAKEMPDYNSAWLATAQPGTSWLWPPDGYHPQIPSAKLAVKHDPRKPIKLLLNGVEVDSLYLDGTVKSDDNRVAVNLWRGVQLEEGDNSFEAVQFDETGAETARVKRVIHYSTPPVKAEFVPAKSRLAADGKTPPVIALRLTDKDGHPARPGVIGEYTILPPYAARQRVDELKQASVTEPVEDRLKYLVDEDGMVLIELQPTTKSGEAVLRLNLVSGVQEVRGRLKPDYRDWILVGLGEGTVGYSAVAGHMESLRDAGEDEKLYQDGRLAFFAKGKIKGSWLLTMAYDSAKGRGNAGDTGLFQTIDPNSYYTLYGDASSQQYDASSARKLYLKLERDHFYLLFGDFDTGLSVTELSRYSRSLNGLKADWHGDRFEANLFGTETAQAYARDEIRGDGTSGLYRLSRKNIVLNTDKITIETRDRLRSEIIVSSQVLSRFLDYSIDYDAGTVFFKQPIRSRDEEFNHVFIVAEYETRDAGTQALSYGGRVGAKLLDDNLKTGVSYIREGQVTGAGNLYGLDASYKIGTTTLKGEVAHSDTNFGGSTREGNAYLAELQHQGPKLQGKLYYREQETGFGLGQLNGSETGTRKGGLDALYKLTDKVSLGGQAYRQYNLATGAVQDVVEETSSYLSSRYGARLGLRHASDRLGDGTAQTSNQLTVGGEWLTVDKRLTLHAGHDQSIGARNNASFPTRTTLGADYKLTEKTMLFAQQEFTSGAGADSNTTSAGMKAVPWQGGAVNTSLGQNLNENGQRIFALFGLKQTWKVTDKWSVDSGVDRSQTVKKPGGYQFNVNVPSASGASQDFTAVSLGSSYQELKWNWNSRLELRNSDLEDKWGIVTAFVGEPKQGWGWSARCQIFDTTNANGSSRVSGDLRFGVVHRPLHARWIILDRLDFLYDRERGAPATLPGGTATSRELDNRRIVNNLNANFRPDAKSQLSLQYGAKYVLQTVDGRNYSGYTDLIGIEGRYDLASDWDVGLRGSLLHSWHAGQSSYSAGPSVGYKVVKNAWISLGYNILGFTDADFSAANYTAQGPFVRFRFKFDQNSVKDAVNWINHE